MTMRVYLAGPDVFDPDAAQRLRARKDICARYGLEGLSPFDNEVAADPAQPAAAARAIYAGNLGQMNAADAIIANLTPFRGVSADAGTVFELGYCAARGLPLFGYSDDSSSYAERVRRIMGLASGASADGEARWIEDFGHADNLMLIEAIASSGGRFFDGRDFADAGDGLAAFEACTEALAALLQSTGGRAV